MRSVFFLAVLSCSSAYAQTYFKPPTATELFDLRSRCAALGREFIDDLVVGGAINKSLISRYDPRTNHCYGDVTTERIDNVQYYNRSLFDLQTGDMLAFAKIEKGGKVGNVFGQAAPMGEDLGFTSANEYINKIMKEDR
jgi:hypothetical protein